MYNVDLLKLTCTRLSALALQFTFSTPTLLWAWEFSSTHPYDPVDSLEHVFTFKPNSLASSFTAASYQLPPEQVSTEKCIDPSTILPSSAPSQRTNITQNPKQPFKSTDLPHQPIQDTTKMSTISDTTKSGPLMKRNDFRRRNGPNTNSYVKSLSPTGQVNKVLKDMANLNGGYHLRNWSSSARKELCPNITIKVEVLDPDGNKVNVNVPKLAFLAASPVFRQHVEGHPKDDWVKFYHEDVTLESMRAISKWLRKICTDKEYTDLSAPNDLQKGLELRLAARILGMAQYTQQIIEGYICGLVGRPVEAKELVIVAELTREDAVVDPILEALASYVAYLCRYHQVSKDREDQYVAVLAGDKCGKLIDAFNDKRIQAVAENRWEAIYRRPVAENN